MRRFIGVLALCCILALSASCAGYRAPVMPPVGTVFSDYKAPLTTEFDGQSVETKQGEAGSFSILGMFAFGDCSVQAAARDGNLSTITHCDYSYLNVLGVYQKFTVIAHGR